MQIIDTGLTFPWSRDKRSATSKIILHHTDSTGSSVQDIHAYHRDANGWNGIGYNYYVRRDGSVYLGRGQEYVGAHCGGENEDSIGIAFEGRYQANNDMSDAQVKAGGELIAFLWGIYGKIPVGCHRDYNATACPGQYFRYDAVLAAAKNSDNNSGESAGAQSGSGSGGSGLYRVQAGAFASKENADKRTAALQAKGFATYVKSEDGLYKVQCGAFADKANAQDLAARIIAAGMEAAVLGGSEGAARCGDYATIDCDWLNVRETPNGKIVGKAGRGEEFKVIGADGDGWIQIVYGAGTGWIYMAYTEITTY